MKIYLTKAHDTFDSIARKFNIKDANYLKTFHNLSCPENDIIHGQPGAGQQIIIPEDSQFLTEKINIRPEENKTPDEKEDPTTQNTDENEYSTDSSYDQNKNQNSHTEQKKDQDKKQENGSSSEHDGKYFVVQKGIAQCNQGFTFPKFKVTSHQKHYWNNADGQEDYLAVTEDDLQFNPSAQSFGQCKLKPTSGGYLPCAYAPTGKWQKTYDKVKVMGKSCLTEISELMCSTGGKITVMKHGQKSEISKAQITNADSQEQQIYNPVVDLDELKDEIDDENNYAH